MRRAIERPSEPGLENAPRKGNDVQDILDSDVFVGFLPDEGDRFGDVRIADGQDVGRNALAYAEGFDGMLAPGELFPAHHATQDLGRVGASPE